MPRGAEGRRAKSYRAGSVAGTDGVMLLAEAVISVALGISRGISVAQVTLVDLCGLDPPGKTYALAFLATVEREFIVRKIFMYFCNREEYKNLIYSVFM